eukprot:gb/GEZN01000148.1/.p1 GENE.gb/GEZN01000148.1/~~gb/GEZN01000148.1/.p1  ORF type:complete len:2144 (+),score=329.45 gb/GEZN01000148.1/:63-6494(+)
MGEMGFTTTLRRVLALDATQSYDVEDADRRGLLRHDRLRLVQCSKRHPEGGETELSKRMTWKIFRAQLSLLDTSLEKELRLEFGRFMQAVSELLGETEGVDEASHVIFRALSHPNSKNPKQELQKFLGPIPEPAWAKLTGISKKLVQAQHEHGMGQNAKPPKQEKKQTDGTRFGAGLAWTDPFGLQEIYAEEDYDLDNLFEDKTDTLGAMIQESAPRSERPWKRPKAAVASSIQDTQEQGGFDLYDWSWLQHKCEQFQTFNEQTGEANISELELASSCLQLLKSNTSDLALQSQLLDLFGMEGFDFVAECLSRRDLLKTLVIPDAAQAQQQLPNRVETPAAAAAVALGQTQQQHKLVGISIQSHTQKKEDQRRKKELRKLARKTEAVPGSANEIDQQRQDEQASSLDDWISSSGGGLGQLPPGATRTENKQLRYEEVYIPPPKQDPVDPGTLVPISSLDEYAQTAFKGTKTLNVLQSKCFQAAYRTNQNLLICAPTGAGKTNVAMLCILNEIGKHITENVLRKELFKIVYVAPMKALAQEVASKFSDRLQSLGVVVKELTGDMQLTKKEIKDTQIIVTTPEKWDVVTRKSGDGALVDMVQLLIIDEVHLLHEERGPVLEILVARTLRRVEQSQRMCRIVGLSATLPNYLDVAVFLSVNPQTGLFYFDGRYRPVPLSQYYVGCREKNTMKRRKLMNDIAYEKALQSLQKTHQVMIFVHARNETVKTARYLKDLAEEREDTQFFHCREHPQFKFWEQKFGKSRLSELRELFQDGFAVHHAGMPRHERSLVEKAFTTGLVSVLVCTATLAWGVNLPAHTVIIKGTQIYDAKRGGYVDVGMLDVMQIFGRAGRPQFDTSGEGFIITDHEKLHHYLSLLTAQMPIESQFISALPDHLNAEIILGTVSNLREAISWLGYTYLYTRMLRNPFIYGLGHKDAQLDKYLAGKRKSLVLNAAKELMRCRMVKFDVVSGNFFSTDLGRVASHYYIHHESIEKYNRMLQNFMTDEAIIHTIACSKEFEQIKVRDEEQDELDKLAIKYSPVKLMATPDSSQGKANVLFQVYISRGELRASTLVSDTYYISQSAGRICRALFEIVLKRGQLFLASRFLSYCKMIDRRQWDFQHPLRQFPSAKLELIHRLEERDLSVDKLLDMAPDEIGALVRQQKIGQQVLTYCEQIPHVSLEADVQPITRQVLKMKLTITPDFTWHKNVHGSVEPFWIWVEDDQNEHIYHHEYWLLHQKQATEVQYLSFTIPIFEPLPPQYYVKAVSDRWLGRETVLAVSFQHLMLPDMHPRNTELLDLHPLSVSALCNKAAQSMYSFSHFNPIQTQVFHTCYHTDEHVLVGAPTGSGKTISAELCMLRLFGLSPGLKCVYIAPMKALARERMEGWGSVKSFGGRMNKKIVELTGDSSPDMQQLMKSDILITTPEKWDGISRHWKDRPYVKQVGLVIIDEIHLLGQDRGPILEVIVSRMRYISTHTERYIRLVGLSTALANAHDLAGWLGVESQGLFNFPPHVRPVPLTIHVAGYPGKHYCPRMATMNKPTYAAISTHSPQKPVLVFVSSRRQTRLTALDLISFAAGDQDPRRFLRMSDEQLSEVQNKVRESNLKHCLSFGIGLHHAGLAPSDRKIVENLFINQKIQVLIATSTLAWGVNFPAHLVVIKGTEFFDAKSRRYVDFPVTDVLQMMGRAGRPQFDDTGKAVVLVHQPKKNFYLNFLHSPFPVESSLLDCLHNHVNAEVVAGTIASIQDGLDYLTWTFLFRRMLVNPSYYQLEDTSAKGVNAFLVELLEGVVQDLDDAGCLIYNEDRTLVRTPLGAVASYYYLDYKTVRMFSEKLTSSCELPDLLSILSEASEYDELPVRHNEDKVVEQLVELVKWKPEVYSFESPHLKASILFQGHLQHMDFPINDFYTDQKSVMDQAIRILQAMVDLAAEAGWLGTALKTMHLVQMIIQARWLTDSTLQNLPHMSSELLKSLWEMEIETLSELLHLPRTRLIKACRSLGLGLMEEEQLCKVLDGLPLLDLSFSPLPKLVLPQEALELCVTLRNTCPRRGASAYAPFFKTKNEGWWLVLGRNDKDELVALKRVLCRSQTQCSLRFDAPSEKGQYIFTVVLMSDTYLGLDQQYYFKLHVKAGDGPEGGGEVSDAVTAART